MSSFLSVLLSIDLLLLCGAVDVLAQAGPADTVVHARPTTEQAVRWYPTRILNHNFYALTFGYERAVGGRLAVEVAGGPVLRDEEYPSAALAVGYNAAVSLRRYFRNEAFYAALEADVSGARYERLGFRNDDARAPYARYGSYALRTRRQEALLAFGWRPLRGSWKRRGGGFDLDLRVGLGAGRSGRFAGGVEPTWGNGTLGLGLFPGRDINTWVPYFVPRLRIGLGYRW